MNGPIVLALHSVDDVSPLVALFQMWAVHQRWMVSQSVNGWILPVFCSVDDACPLVAVHFQKWIVSPSTNGWIHLQKNQRLLL